MDPVASFLKYRFEHKEIDANFYNNHIFPAVQQKLIKDITPKGTEFANDPTIRVWAIVEFPDGSRFRLVIREKPFVTPPLKSKDYDVEIERVL
jgi:hypothetical protein